jgi:hypothetical protein
MRADLVGNAGAAVQYADLDAARGGLGGLDGQIAPGAGGLVHGLHGIAREVDDHLLNLNGVGRVCGSTGASLSEG